MFLAYSTIKKVTRAMSLAMFALFVAVSFVSAEPNQQINYQGKLTDSSGVAVPDGSYNMRFWLLQSTSQATTSAVWTESLTGADQVQVTNGLFSVMLGSTSPLTSVDFGQTLYLGVEIGGTGAPAWDGEMSPRKPLGAVPAAFESMKLGGVASSSFLRSDEADQMIANTFDGTPVLTIQQTRSIAPGDVLSLLDYNSNDLFTVTAAGRVGIGTTTMDRLLNVAGATNAGARFTDTTNEVKVDVRSEDFQGFLGTFSNHDLRLITNNTSRLTITSGGNVGIGTSTPTARLDVSGSIQTTSTSSHIYVNRYGAITDVNYIGITNDRAAFGYNGSTANTAIHGGSGKGIEFNVNSSVFGSGTAAVITPTGNVGIGTTSPYAKLSVAGDIALTGGVYDNNATRGTTGQVLQTTGAGVEWVATSSLGFLSDTSGDWVGTFDGQEGSYYIANSFSTTSANFWETQQTARTADNLTDNSIEELSDVAAMTKNYGDLFYWNGTAWADIATSSLGLGDGTFLGLSDTPGSFTSNAIPYVSGSALAFDSTFVYDGTNLGLGTASPGAMLDIFGAGNSLRLSYDGSNYAELSVDSSGILSLASTGGTGSGYTLGSGLAEDTFTLFDGNALDYYFGLDDSDDTFKLGTGSTVGANVIGAFTSATSTFNTAIVASTTATSTFTNGIALSGGCFQTADGNCLNTAGDTSVVVAASDSPAAEKAYADYVADGTSDEVEIQQAIDYVYANGGGGTVYLLAGNFEVSTSTAPGIAINMATNTQLIGQGVSTVIKLKDNNDLGDVVILRASSTPRVAISSLKIDGNQANQSSSQTAVYLSDSSSSTISELEVVNVDNYGADVNNSTDVLVINNKHIYGINVFLSSRIRIKNNNIAGIDIDGSSDVEVASNNISENWDGIAAYNSSRLSIQNNTMWASADSALYFENITYSNVANNVISNTGKGVTLTEESMYNVISSNQLSNLSAGIYFDAPYSYAPSHNIVSNNVIRNIFGSFGANGIFLGWGASDNTISNNKIENVGHAAIAAYSRYGGNAANNVISNNQLYSIGLSGAHPAIDIAETTNIAIVANSIYSTSTYALIEIASGAVDTTLASNHFENPNSTNYIADASASTRYNEWDRTTITTDSARGYNLFSIIGSTTATSAAITQLGAGDILTLDNASGRVLTMTNSGNLGLGTSSPAAKLSVAGNTWLDSNVINFASSSASSLLLHYFTAATSTVVNGDSFAWTIATSSSVSPIFRIDTSGSYANTLISGGFDVNNGAISYNAATNQTTIENLALGNMKFEDDAGVVTWTDMGVTAGASVGTVESYTAAIDGNSLLTLYGESDGAGSVTDLAVGIGTTSPWARFSVLGDATDATKPLLTVASSTGDTLFHITNAGRVGIGTTSPAAKLAIQNTAFSGAGVVGLDQYLETQNSVLSAVQYGNRFFLDANNTATTTIVGSMIRLRDDTTYGNTVRTLEVQANRGANTYGENTAISAFARTFGVRAVTTGEAGDTYEPAAGFFETEGTAQGNAIRAYTDTLTTASLLSLFQSSSTFAGTGLEMNFGNGTGSFSSSTSKYLDFQNGGASVFTVSAYGTTTIGDGTTNHLAGLQIGFGGICVDNDGSCTASTSGRITSVESLTGNSDLAEMYFSSTNLEPGEVVVLDGELSIDRAEQGSDMPVLGVVSTKPGLLLGFDDSSLRAGERGYPLALSGRVPVKLSTENGPIKRGDSLMLSSLPGVAMKATGTGATIGIALEDFDDARKYSETYLNQFGDDMVEPVYEPIYTNLDPRLDDGCYYGGGNAVGDEPCVPLSATTTQGQIDEANHIAEAESVAEQMDALRDERSETKRLADGTAVKVGRVVMFVDRSYRWFDDSQLASLGTLFSTSSIETVGDNEDETIFDRLVTLANNFVDGVLSVFTLKADKVETSELCVDGVCVTADDLRTMLNTNSSAPVSSNNSPVTGEGSESSEEGAVSEPPTEVLPPNSATSTDGVATTTEELPAPVDTATSSSETEAEQGVPVTEAGEGLGDEVVAENEENIVITEDESLEVPEPPAADTTEADPVSATEEVEAESPHSEDAV